MRMFLLLMLIAALSSGPLSAAPPHLPGDLARDRLQGMDALLLSPGQITVSRLGQPGTPLPPAQAKVVSACLSDLVLDDALYVEDAGYERDGNSETLTVGQGLQCVTVAIRRDRPYLTIMLFGGNRMVSANYLPVLPKLVRLLRAVDPDDHSLSTFHPQPSPLPLVKGIPASALARIATIKPGMTRADVLHVFTTEGGLFGPYWNHYVYQDYGLSTIGRRDGLVTVGGELVKVNIDFAPRDADTVWFNGRGFWLHQSSYQSRPGQSSINGQPDDIILRVSPPYLQHMVLD